MRATILSVPEQQMFGHLITQDGKELYFDINYYPNPKTLDRIKIGDQVIIEKTKTLGKSVIRPVEMRQLSKEDILLLNKTDLKNKMNELFPK